MPLKYFLQLFKRKSTSQKSKNLSDDIKEERPSSFYWVLAGIRILLTLIPQRGYIHPDEFFQSIEVIAGDRFDIDVNKPWEFNVTFPIRSPFISQLSIGIPYTLINIISPYLWHLFQYNIKTSYFLVIFPRLLICLLSFVTDYCLYQICRLYKEDFRKRLVIYASSYVTMVYYTRTLSNAIESLLVALIIYYVSRCIILSEKIVVQSDYFSEAYDKAQSIVERVKYYKLRASLPSHSLNHCLILASISVLGIFNRPTFIAFLLPPIFFWLRRGLGSRSVNLWDFHIRIAMFIICGIPMVLLMIIIDSFYFGYLSLIEIMTLDIGFKNFVVTPLNFLKYNSVSKNLANHGLHPRFFHFLINVPLLFNVLGIIGLITSAKLAYSIMTRRWSDLPRIQSIESMMIACFLSPIALLSIFPHQEPRFIIPTLLPIVFLYTPVLENASNFSSIGCRNTNKIIHILQKNVRGINKLQHIWWISNILLIIFYGFIHQGGVLSLTTHLAKELKAKPELTHVHLYTSYIYSLPTALLLLRNTQKTYVSSANHRYKLKQDFFLYERGSQSTNLVYDEIKLKLNECEKKFIDQKIPYRIYYAMPLNSFSDLMEYTIVNNTKEINFSVVKIFYPHVSTEKLPTLNLNIIECLVIEKLDVCIEKITHNIFHQIVQVYESFGLLLLRIQRSKNNNVII
ncbi:GPI mannosyltransferase 4 [Chelonus insularis]|uniref:GPI mannosyltransferase 4 n=1 Tax=Chelonus insularis TaxID=460826 RepID=UPI00158D5225|nr:GPI mannosyltransferase 4 [Chelonus insularis]